MQPQTDINPSQVMTGTLNPVGFSTDQLAQRDLFGLAPLGAGTSDGNFVNSDGQSLPPHLMIVGVVIGHPSEVIIEDTQANQTFFVKEGQTVGAITLERASKQRVSLMYQGQPIEVELHP